MNVIMKFYAEDGELSIEVCENGIIMVSIEDGNGCVTHTIKENDTKKFINELNNLKEIKKIVDSNKNTLS